MRSTPATPTATFIPPYLDPFSLLPDWIQSLRAMIRGLIEPNAVRILSPGFSKSTAFCLGLAERFGQKGDNLLEVSQDPVIRGLKNAGLGIVVDRDDDPGLSDADEVLRGAPDADGEVEPGRDRTAGESHLMLPGEPSRVAYVARGRDRGVQDIRQRLDDRKILRATDP